MPGIVVFRRRWGVGSDDLVVPGVFLFVLHTIWVIVLSVLLGVVEFDRTVRCVSLLWEHIIGYMVILSGCLILELCIAVVAMRGTILDTEPRSSMEYLLYVRLGIMCVELVWLILGVIWLSYFYKDCAIEVAKEALLGIVICNWCVLASVLITVWCTFDAAGRSWVKMKKYQRSMKEGESKFQYKRSGSRHRNWRQRKVIRAYQDSWDHRCRLLFCCMGKSDRNRNSFADIARLLSEFFRDLDVVPSDVVAGLVLLRQYQKMEREAIVSQRKNDTYEFLSGVAVTPRTQFVTLTDPQVLEDFRNVIHYMNFALGAYGWPMFLITHSGTGVCQLCPRLRCCCFPCCCGNDPATIVEDNCCQCNYAALRKLLEVGEVEVVYATYHVDVGETPFFVAVDYLKKKIVISIRGTLSMKDVITDLNAEGEPLPLNPINEDFLGHKGMVQAAEYIREKIKEENILEKAFSHNPDRGTQEFELVLVGHSLGAGTAAILAILLRQEYPNLQCFSYSPPGGLLSLPAVEYSKTFITSVVVGKDVVPRIGLHQLESLRADLINAIKRSKDSKWKTITSSVMCCACKTAEDEHGENFEIEKNKDAIREIALHPSDSSIALTVHQPLYPPGKIMHIVRHHPKKGEQLLNKHEPVYQALWANNTDFDEVLISPVMIQDHMPDKVLAALEKVVTNIGPAKPQRVVTSQNNSTVTSVENFDSEKCHLLASSPGSPKAVTPPHKLCLETSFTSLSPDPTNSNIASLHSSNGSQNGNGKLNGHVSPFALHPILSWEYASVLEEQLLATMRNGTRPNLQNFMAPKEEKVDLIHDDWFGLAPLATPESLSEVSSISSRASFVSGLKEKTMSVSKLENLLIYSDQHPNGVVKVGSRLSSPRLQRYRVPSESKVPSCDMSFKSASSQDQLNISLQPCARKANVSETDSESPDISFESAQMSLSKSGTPDSFTVVDIHHSDVEQASPPVRKHPMWKSNSPKLGSGSPKQVTFNLIGRGLSEHVRKDDFVGQPNGKYDPVYPYFSHQQEYGVPPLNIPHYHYMTNTPPNSPPIHTLNSNSHTARTDISTPSPEEEKYYCAASHNGNHVKGYRPLNLRSSIVRQNGTSETSSPVSTPEYKYSDSPKQPSASANQKTISPLPLLTNLGNVEKANYSLPLNSVSKGESSV